jgi:hypothetical protein
MPFGNSKKRKEAEKKAVMARLAAVETLGLLDQSAEQTSVNDRARAMAGEDVRKSRDARKAPGNRE